jgi:outer membrane protein, heavy metal efflux system
MVALTRTSRNFSLVTCFRVVTSMGALGFAGCSTYTSSPITDESVNQALAQKPLDSISVQLSELNHPLIQPIVIQAGQAYTPDELAVMSVVLSPELKALRDQNKVAESQVIQAGLLPNPQLGYSVDKPTQVYDPAVTAAKNLNISYDLVALLTHHDLHTAAKEAAKSVNLSVAWQEWQYAQATRVSAYRILSLQQRLPSARLIEEDLRTSLAESKIALEKGYQTSIDVANLSTAYNQARSVRFDMEQQLLAERSFLNLCLGRNPTEIVPIKAVSDIAVDDIGSVTDGELEKSRLDLVALKAGYSSQDYALRAAVKSQFPRIGIQVNKANDTTPISTRGLAVNFDIPIFDRNQGQIAIAQATRQQLFDEYVARVAEARSQVGQLNAQINRVKVELGSASEAYAQQEAIVNALKRTGNNLDYQVYRDARSQLANRFLELSALKQELLELVVALEIATGKPLASNHFTKSNSP